MKKLYSNLLILIFLSFIFLMHTHQSLAKEISFTAEVSDNKIGLDSSLKLILVINGTQDVSPLQIAEINGIDGFRVKFVGPLRRISNINGQQITSIAFNYTLFPTRVGVFQIPSFALMINNTKYTSEAISIEVVDSIGSLISNPQGQSIGIKDKIFIVLKAPKQEVFINEKIPIKILFYYSDVNIRDVQYPKIENLGFSMGNFENPQQYSNIMNGKRFEIIEFDTTLYPTRIGNITLGPATLECNMLISNTRRQSSFDRFGGLFNDDFFNSFFNQYEKRPLTLESEEIQISVLPLPEKNKPDGFTGAVGNFFFDASVSPQEVRVGDPITLKMKIEGEGNLTAVNFPMINDDRQFKLYDPIIKEEGNKKTLEQVIIPKSSIIQEIPAIEFSYFDTGFKRYNIIKKGPFPIKVNISKQQDALKIVGLKNRIESMQPEIFGEDIVFIKNNPGTFQNIGYRIYKNFLFYILIGFVSALWIFFYLYLKQTHRLETDIVFARRLRAPKYLK